MEIQFGKGKTKYGPGVQIDLTGDEVAIAISAYLVAHGAHISGARTIRVNGELCENGSIYVDPDGFLIKDGEKYSGRGPSNTMTKEEFVARFKKLCRQLSERQVAVEFKKKPDKYYQEKRSEFISLIDRAVASGWFVMPPSNTRVYKIYHDKWN
jgi:hypothetical protein